jgi:hypothetical protein
MGFANKKSIRQAHLEEARGPVSRPVDHPITHVMGPGSKFTQDVYGDSYFKKPLTPSRSDVFGKEASSQGFRLHKPGK